MTIVPVLRHASRIPFSKLKVPKRTGHRIRITHDTLVHASRLPKFPRWTETESEVTVLFIPWSSYILGNNSLTLPCLDLLSFYFVHSIFFLPSFPPVYLLSTVSSVLCFLPSIFLSFFFLSYSSPSFCLTFSFYLVLAIFFPSLYSHSSLSFYLIVLPIYSSIYLSLHLSVHLSIYPFTCLLPFLFYFLSFSYSFGVAL